MEAGGGGEGEFNDWEMLQPEAEEIVAAGELVEEEGVGTESEGLMMLRLNYFSIDSGMEFSRTGGKSDLSSEAGGSVESDNPSWIDPASSEAPFPRKNSGDFWSDSASEGANSCVCEEKTELGFEMENRGQSLRGFGYDFGGESSVGVEFDGAQPVEETIVTVDDSVQKMDVKEEERLETEMEVSGGENGVLAAEGIVTVKELELPIEEGKKVTMWWKLPLELVKYCVFRVSPLWSISVAAAMVGVFIMRRRLQKMKRRAKSLQMKVTVDDKKVDQFMSRAAKLNEAFSVVRRVPIIRPPLPAPGVTLWPVMSLR